MVYALTGSTVDLSWVTLSFMIPTVAFALWGGVVADRLPKRRIIVTGQSLNFVASLALAFIIYTGQVTFWDFIWFGFFNGTVLALSMPARQAFVPELIPDKLIFTAMALNTTSWNLSRILGPPLAGFLIAWLADGDQTSSHAVGIVYFVIAGLYLISAVTVFFVSVPGKVKEPDGSSPLNDAKEALLYVVNHPSIFGLIVLSILPFVFGMPLNALLPAFNADVLGGGADDFGVLTSAMGGGAIIGSLMLASMGNLKNKARWLIATTALWGVATVLFGATSTFFWAVIAIAGFGWLSAWNMSLNRGLLQLQVDAHMRGRILSIDIMSHGLMPIGLIPISFIAETHDVGTALMVSGAALLIITILLAIVSPTIRRVDWLGDQRL